jgi:serine/threonine protein kinase
VRLGVTSPGSRRNALVHRDIKPQNIMLTRSDAELLDFNISVTN